jgi:hypothetical protein
MELWNYGTMELWNYGTMEKRTGDSGRWLAALNCKDIHEDMIGGKSHNPPETD